MSSVQYDDAVFCLSEIVVQPGLNSILNSSYLENKAFGIDSNGFSLQLVLLDISNNKLKFFPESIGSCFSLEELQANGTVKF